MKRTCGDKSWPRHLTRKRVSDAAWLAGVNVEPAPRLYDEDAEQDRITGRGHFGNTIPEGWGLDAANPDSDLSHEGEVDEMRETCQRCGLERDDHQLRGHVFVQWQAQS